MAKGGLGEVGNKEAGGNDPRNYKMVFPAKAGLRPYSVEGCSGQEETRMAMMVHFWYQNIRYTVLIL